MSSAALALIEKHGAAKSPEAFRTISEVALELDVPQHVLRFWESRFAQIKPVKRAGGRRYYRPDDVDLLKGIRALLYNDGFTIKGVQKVLKERGLRHVAEVGRGGKPVQAAPVVIEKIVYVEKPAPVPAPVKKRPTHLRAVPVAMSLPLFDEPAQEPMRDFPVLDSAPTSVVEPMVEAIAESFAKPAVESDGPAIDERERLEALLDELLGLKARIQATKEPK
ncbi:MAG TPA: MerR family transcriptional regulator [Rhizomicrobium sp.]